MCVYVYPQYTVDLYIFVLFYNAYVWPAYLCILYYNTCQQREWIICWRNNNIMVCVSAWAPARRCWLESDTSNLCGNVRLLSAADSLVRAFYVASVWQARERIFLHTYTLYTIIRIHQHTHKHTHLRKSTLSCVHGVFVWLWEQNFYRAC